MSSQIYYCSLCNEQVICDELQHTVGGTKYKQTK